MALDAIGLGMVCSRIKGAAILCLGYPDITARPETVEQLLLVKPRKFTPHGRDHKVSWPLPETIDTMLLAGADVVDCVDYKAVRGVERVVDLNCREEWPRRYELVINPGTIEHCFDLATAMFNAWRAVELGGAVLHVAPMSMMNHGFVNFCPTLIADFAFSNGGAVKEMLAVDRERRHVQIDLVRRFRAPAEVVLYTLVEKVAEIPETIPTQWRYRQ